MAFQCTFAGIPFRLPTPEVEAFVEKFGLLENLNDIYGSVPPGRSLLALGRQALPCPKPKLGQLFWPCGMSRCGVFHGIATGQDVAKMQAAALPTSGPLSGGFAELPFVMQNDGLGGSQSLSVNMQMLPARPISIVDGDASGGLFIVTLVDDRWYRRFFMTDFLAGVNTCSAASGSAHGMARPACSTGSPTITRRRQYPFTITAYPSGVPSVYGVPEPDSTLYGSSEPETLIIDAIAANIGGFFTLGYDGNYIFQSWNKALAATLAAQLPSSQRIAGGLIFNPNTGVADQARKLTLPQYIVVGFPSFNTNAGLNVGYTQPENYRDFFRRGNTYGQLYCVKVTAASLGAPYSTYTETLNEAFWKSLRTTAKFSGTSPNTSTACLALRSNWRRITTTANWLRWTPRSKGFSPGR